MKIDIKAWAQLLRIPNVFTALADVIAGALLALVRWPEGDEVLTLIRVCLASACLYSAGMVLNDFFDVEEDTRERPFRPIPSGRVRRKTAGIVGFVLLTTGLVLGLSWNLALVSTNLIAPTLAAMILLYDAWLKHTNLGPLAMGCCRFLNILLGGISFITQYSWVILGSITVGIYVWGITHLAKGEANLNQIENLKRKRQSLVAGTMLIFGAFVSLFVFLTILCYGREYVEMGNANILLLLSFIWILIIGTFVTRALIEPQPVLIQAAIKACIFGLIGLDSIFAYAAVGPAGLLFLLLLIPSIILGRFIYST